MDKPNLPLSTSPSHLLLAGRGVCVRAPRITGWRCPFHLPGEANPLAATTAVFTYVFEKLTVLPWALQHSSRVKVLVIQSCPTLCDPMDRSPPGSSVHGIPQARVLEWVAIPFSRGSSQPRDWILVSCTAGNSLLFEPPMSSPAFISYQGVKWPVCSSPRVFIKTKSHDYSENQGFRVRTLSLLPSHFFGGLRVVCRPARPWHCSSGWVSGCCQPVGHNQHFF